MAGIGKSPYALFVNAEDTISHRLAQNCDREGGIWDLYLATDACKDAPQKRTDNRINERTTAPVISFPIPSPFAGQTIEAAAKWLKAAADDVDLDRGFFAVLHENYQMGRNLDREADLSKGEPYSGPRPRKLFE